MQRRMTIPPTNTFYSCKFQRFSKQISTMKAIQVYNLASVIWSLFVDSKGFARDNSIASRNSQECIQVDMLLCLRTMQCLIDKKLLLARKPRSPSILRQPQSKDCSFHTRPTQKIKLQRSFSCMNNLKFAHCRVVRNL